MVNEVIRFGAVGFPISALREAPRDGHLLDYDYAEGELILLNQLVYFNDGRVWEAIRYLRPGDKKKPVFAETATLSEDDAGDNHFDSPDLPFNPHRFLRKCNSDPENEQFRLEIPGHWTRHMLTGHVVCVPNDFVYRLLTTILVHMFGTGLSVTIGEGSAMLRCKGTGDNHFLRNPRDVPPISLACISDQ